MAARSVWQSAVTGIPAKLKPHWTSVPSECVTVVVDCTAAYRADQKPKKVVQELGKRLESEINKELRSV
jgi:hypothetical protein